MGRGARSTKGRKEQGERGEAEGKGEREEGVRGIEEREGKRGRKIEGRKIGIGSSSLLLSSEHSGTWQDWATKTRIFGKV